MADMKITEYNSHNAPATGDQFFMIGTSEEYRIDYDALAGAILDKLTTKTYSGINNNVISAIAALNSSANMLSLGTAIPSGASLETYKTPGTYYVSSNSVAASIGGLPEATAGRVIVEAEGSAAVIRQIYKPYNSLLEYVRRISGATIGAWEKLPTRSEFIALEARVTALENK